MYSYFHQYRLTNIYRCISVIKKITKVAFLHFPAASTHVLRSMTSVLSTIFHTFFQNHSSTSKEREKSKKKKTLREREIAAWKRPVIYTTFAYAPELFFISFFRDDASLNRLTLLHQIEKHIQYLSPFDTISALIGT